MEESASSFILTVKVDVLLTSLLSLSVLLKLYKSGLIFVLTEELAVILITVSRLSLREGSDFKKCSCRSVYNGDSFSEALKKLEVSLQNENAKVLISLDGVHDGELKKQGGSNENNSFEKKKTIFSFTF